MTTAGEVLVRVGRTRDGGSATAPLGRYARCRPEIDAAVTQAYVGGVSTRDMAGVTTALLGKGIGLSTVSRVTKRLEDQVDQLRREPITEPFPYLYLDATFVDARWARTVENVSALVAYGVGFDGQRQLLGIHIGAQEAEASWSELLAELVARGLSGVQLIIRDEHAGLIAAARKVLPEARQQRCTVHLMRNVFTRVPHRQARPFIFKGYILKPVSGWTTHHSIVKFQGEWYLFYHDATLSKGIDYKRNNKVAELTYNADGTIQTFDPYQ